MDTYDRAAEAAARSVMKQFSTSFGLATRMFGAAIRQDIYNIYGLVRIADEIVDSYKGSDSAKLLDNLETETKHAVKTGYSTNVIVHAYSLTARRYQINPELMQAFFASMRADIKPESYKPSDYEDYIYGSAEVVGLMCLAVFCQGDNAFYEHLKPGARALGAAFQKVNFLRDMAADYKDLGRYYFPVGSYEKFDEVTKQAIIKDISADFVTARTAIDQLPGSARPAVLAAYRYYHELLNKLTITPATEIKSNRVRVSDGRKAVIFAGTGLRHKLRRAS